MSYTETIKLLNRIEQAVDEYAESELDLPSKIVISKDVWDGMCWPEYGAPICYSRVLFGVKVMVLPADKMDGKEFYVK